MSTAQEKYDARVLAEIDTFRDQKDVHDLPEIFHYWSNSKIRPKLEAFGLSCSRDMFQRYLWRQCERETSRTLRFVSIGAGNCDLEITLAQLLKSAGCTNFVLDCLDLNETMLERGRLAAREAGVEAQIGFQQGDFNRWEPAHEYDAVLASQSLHHVVNLEGLFRQVRASLAPQGQFIVSDMIGRNGHQRWPEAMEILQEFWKELPESYRYNRMLRRHEESYMDWDCSKQGFEGIRAQDVLPLLLSNFRFEFFFAYGNLIDPFVDRAFGHHFDPSRAWDRDFIDRVHQRDEEAMLAGIIKPVHMEAVLRKDPPEALHCQQPFTPAFCMRYPDSSIVAQALENQVEQLVQEKANLERANAELARARAELELNLSTVQHEKAVLAHDKAVIEQRAATLALQVRMASESRWLKVGHRIGVGPRFQ